MLNKFAAGAAFLGWILACLISTGALAQDGAPSAPPAATDTLAADSLANDSTAVLTPAQQDSVFLDSLQRKGSLKFNMFYEAKDSIVIDLTGNEMRLYEEGHVKYQNREILAHRVRVQWTEQLMHARGRLGDNDSLTGTPVFKEGDKDTMYAESMVYNFETQKGKILYGKTKQGEDIVAADDIKRNPDQSFYAKDARFTTCDKDHPHFYIQSNKIKMIPEDRIVSGPLYFVVADVPIPIIIPFGFFPINEERTSGIILPTYGESGDRGFFLRGLGYYLAINDYVDLTLTGNIFTNGTYQLNAVTRYTKRYRYDGNLQLSYSNERFNMRGDPDFRRNTQYFVRWTHNQPVNPQASLTASVEAGASNFLQRNSFSVQQNLRNTLQSSISYQHSFPRAGWRVVANLNHRQDLTQKTIQLDLPSLSFQRDRLYPFKRKNAVGAKKWYEQIGITYNSEIRNQISIADSLLFTTAARDNFRNGMRHNVNINTNFKVLKHLNITPSFGYREYWYLETLEQNYLTETYDSVVWRGGELVRAPVTRSRLEENRQDGFAAARDFNVSVAAATNVYGILQTRSKRQRAFRHVFRPSVSYTYRPDFSTDFWGYYESVRINEAGDARLYSRFQNGIFGGPGQGLQQIVSLSLNNQYEMKFLPDQTEGDTAEQKFKYVTLLDNLGANASYNMAADSFNLSQISASARTNLLDNLINLNFSGRFDPYTYNRNTGRSVDAYIWNAEGKLPRLTNASFALTTKLKSWSPKSRTIDAETEAGKKPPPPTPKEKYAALYQNFRLPWTLNVGYTASLNRRPTATQTTIFGPEGEPIQISDPLTGQLRDSTTTRFLIKEEIIHSLNLNGTFQVTDKWRVGFFTNYDFQLNKLGTTSLDITRDLHCWELTFNVVPFGRFTRYLLTVNVKAATLRDLKVTKRREWQDQFTDF